MANNFNFVAPFYDALARIVFGNTIRASQKTYLREINDDYKILVLGGGTGWILQELDLQKKSIYVEYVEASVKMLEKAKSRGPFDNITVNFVLDDSYQTSNKFDAVLTFFFLDVFNHTNLVSWVKRIDELLKSDGKWLITDFKKSSRRSHRVLLQLMHAFFKMTCNLEVSTLLDIFKFVEDQGYAKQRSQYFYNQMIESAVYKKPTST